MGNNIALQFAALMQEHKRRQEHAERESVFLKDNSYGYKINISHPRIYGRYIAWLRERGISTRYPVDDAVRREFEEEIIALMRERAKERIKNNEKR